MDFAYVHCLLNFQLEEQLRRANTLELSLLRHIRHATNATCAPVSCSRRIASGEPRRLFRSQLVSRQTAFNLTASWSLPKTGSNSSSRRQSHSAFVGTWNSYEFVRQNSRACGSLSSSFLGDVRLQRELVSNMSTRRGHLDSWIPTIYATYEDVQPEYSFLGPLSFVLTPVLRKARVDAALLEAQFIIFAIDLNLTLPFLRLALAFAKLCSASIEALEEADIVAFFSFKETAGAMGEMMDIIQYSASADDLFGNLHHAQHLNMIHGPMVADNVLQVIDNVDEPDMIKVRGPIAEAARPTLRALAVTRVAEALKKDCLSMYFCAGKLAEDVYAPECYFADPVISMVGFKQWRSKRRLVTLLLKDVNMSLLDLEVVYPITTSVLLSRVCPEETRDKILANHEAKLAARGLSDDDDSEWYEHEEGDPDHIDAVMVARWEVKATLRLPWRPQVIISGRTEYQLAITEECFVCSDSEILSDEERLCLGRIISHSEQWDLPLRDYFQQVITPA